MTDAEERINKIMGNPPTSPVPPLPPSKSIQEMRDLVEVKKLELELQRLEKGAENNINPFNQVLEILKESHAKDLEFLGQINDLKVQIAELQAGNMGEDDGILSFFEKIAPYLPQLLNKNQTSETYSYNGNIPEVSKVESTAVIVGTPKTQMENPQLTEYKKLIKEGKVTEEQALKDYRKFVGKISKKDFKIEFDKIKNGN